MTDPQSTEAMSLRVQALALLQQAQQLDGLYPYLVHHSHEYNFTGYLVWASGPDLSEEAAATVLESSFEPEKNESLDIESGISLEEIAGVDITKRVGDLDDDDSDDDTFPQEYHTAINRMDYQHLKDLLEANGFAVNASESEDELREAVRANVLDGTIDKREIDITNV